jgi:hypothetical protein
MMAAMWIVELSQKDYSSSATLDEAWGECGESGGSLATQVFLLFLHGWW